MLKATMFVCLVACGGNVAPPIDDAGAGDAAAEASSQHCHPPGIVKSCDELGVDCSTCPTSCTWTTDAGTVPGECQP